MTALIESVPVERHRRTTSLIRAFRLLSVLGYTEGIAGHISVRDPEHDGYYWVNPFGTDFSVVRREDLLLISPAGKIVEGEGELNPSVDPLHGELHRARPELSAFVHTHSMHGKTWASLGRLLDPISQDASVLYRRHSIYANFRGLISDREEGREIAEVMSDHSAVILQNHGFLTSGMSVEEATWLFIVMERAAQSQLMAEAAGTPLPISHDVAVVTGQELTGSKYAVMQFDNLYASVFQGAADVG